MKKIFTSVFIFLFISINAQQSGEIIKKIIHSKLLEKTITKESPDRNVSIYLPPSYAHNKNKHYSVVYLFHGFAGTDDDWIRPRYKGKKFMTIKSVMDEGIANGKFGEMIVVMTNQSTNSLGGWYVNSKVTGNWKDFTTKELINYIDSNYRTIKKAQNRGIVGHSMGGYGAITLAMENPDTYSVLYALNPALIDFVGDLTSENKAFERISTSRSLNELIANQDVWSIGLISMGQAFSPNINNPPFYTNLPYHMENGKLIRNNSVYQLWKKQSPSQLVKRYVNNASKLKGIKLDSGFYDEFKFIILNTRVFSKELTKNGINHIFEEYNGDHRNRLWGKQGRLYSDVFPYFWELLEHK